MCEILRSGGPDGSYQEDIQTIRTTRIDDIGSVRIRVNAEDSFGPLRPVVGVSDLWIVIIIANFYWRCWTADVQDPEALCIMCDMCEVAPDK